MPTEKRELVMVWEAKGLAITWKSCGVCHRGQLFWPSKHYSKTKELLQRESAELHIFFKAWTVFGAIVGQELTPPRRLGYCLALHKALFLTITVKYLYSA